MRRFLPLLLPLLAACASAGSSGGSDGEPQAGAAGVAAGSAGSPAGQGGSGNPGGSAGSGNSGGSSAGSAGRAGEGGDAGQAGKAGSGGAPAGAGGAGAGGAGQGGAGESGAGQAGSGAPFGGSAGSGEGGAGQAGSAQGGAGTGSGGFKACEAAFQVSVAPDQPLKLSDDTSGLSNQLGAYCDSLGANGKDKVFKIIPKATGTVTVTLTATDDTYDPVLSVTKGECTNFVTNKDGDCTNFSGPGGGESMDVDVVKDEPFWVYVDGVKSQDGAFSLSIEYPSSGQGGGGSGGSGQAGSGGAGQGGAGSDQGGAGQSGGGAGSGGAGQAGSGGAPTPVGQSCSDPVKLQLKLGDTLSLDGSTVGAKNTFFGYCNINGDGPDQVVEVTAQSAGKVTAKLTPNDDNYDVALYGLNGDCSTVLLLSETNGGKGDCSELFGPGVAETLDPIAVAQGDKVYLYVDSNKKNGTVGGPFTLTVTLELKT